MLSIITQDPYLLGPDVAGMATPDQSWAMVPDTERTASPRQAIMAFEAGAAHGDFLLTDQATAGALFLRLQADLEQSRPAIDREASSVLLALWRLPCDRAALLVADLEGGFARAALARDPVAAGLHPTSRLRFDAAQLKSDPRVPEATRSVLELLTR